VHYKYYITYLLKTQMTLRMHTKVMHTVYVVVSDTDVAHCESKK